MENKQNNKSIDMIKILLIIIVGILLYFGVTYYKDRQEKIKKEQEENRKKQEQQKMINDTIKSIDDELKKYIK